MVLGLLAVAVCGLVFIQADFEISGRGELQPRIRRQVFAEIDGVVDVPPVSHGTRVTSKQQLLALRNVDLEYEFSRVTGEIAAKEQARDGVLGKLLSLDFSAVDAIPTRNSLTAEKKELDAQLESLLALKAILDKQQKLLTVQSPIDGRVLTWDVEQLLLDRPIKRGQRLVTVADLQGPWILELHVSDRDIGHVSAARLKSDNSLQVEFVLATNPDESFLGSVTSVAMNTTTNEEGDSTVLVTVDIDEAEIGDLRPGATVIPRIRCGRRSLGYVWFHGVWDWFKTRVMF
ncbi:MAG: HlyD family efflux transporter periplasmic adaptor subunit [Planctomycetota bacterium]|nr:HlyD family efflux transporter periplasmic adaptor subunit [Planctomycetota bacterium]